MKMIAKVKVICYQSIQNNKEIKLKQNYDLNWIVSSEKEKRPMN